MVAKIRILNLARYLHAIICLWCILQVTSNNNIVWGFWLHCEITGKDQDSYRKSNYLSRFLQPSQRNGKPPTENKQDLRQRIQESRSVLSSGLPIIILHKYSLNNDLTVTHHADDIQNLPFWNLAVENTWFWKAFTVYSFCKTYEK